MLPVKIPSLLMLGSDGIAVGMATKIMPHNFNELLNAQISELRGEPFELFPDFQQGGLMDVSDYQDGNGKITLRAKIDIDGRKLIIREIPATTTTESLIASIEKAAEKNKIKIASVNDYTTQHAEIEIVPTRGYDPEKTRQALYMYTDCSVSISVNLTVICESRPAVMSVTDVIRRNTRKLLEYLKRELEIELAKQEDLFHAKTLAQIFFENRIYKCGGGVCGGPCRARSVPASAAARCDGRGHRQAARAAGAAHFAFRHREKPAGDRRSACEDGGDQ